MEKLTRQEEVVMRAVWRTGEGVVKDFIGNMDGGEEVPYTTVASVVRNLEKKGFVTSRKISSINLYTPKITLDQYKKKFLNGVVKNYFTDSYKDVVAFFVKEKKLSKEELREIIELIENENQ